MTPKCPQCASTSENSIQRPPVVRSGRFYRRSDSKWVQRFICRGCRQSFSTATLDPRYRQNKRQYNPLLAELLVSCVSQRRAARVLKLNRKTVVRKFLFLAQQARLLLAELNKNLVNLPVIEFDDLETFEHTKCKPLSITLAVQQGTRKILAIQVSRMPAKGPLAELSRKKYGKRKDERRKGRRQLLEALKAHVAPTALIKSDQNPHYPEDIKKYFPQATHKTFKGRKGCVVGQGELKKIGRDPLFSLNHTCAMLRADINRLVRRTWCTTKLPERLEAHLYLYAAYHNQMILKEEAKRAAKLAGI